jgi:hypothetical protein
MSLALPVVVAGDPEGHPPLSALNDLLFCERRLSLVPTENAILARNARAGFRRRGSALESAARTAFTVWTVGFCGA